MSSGTTFPQLYRPRPLPRIFPNHPILGLKSLWFSSGPLEERLVSTLK